MSPSSWEGDGPYVAFCCAASHMHFVVLLSEESFRGLSAQAVSTSPSSAFSPRKLFFFGELELGSSVELGRSLLGTLARERRRDFTAVLSAAYRGDGPAVAGVSSGSVSPSLYFTLGIVPPRTHRSAHNLVERQETESVSSVAAEQVPFGAQRQQFEQPDDPLPQGGPQQQPEQQQPEQ
ncbi:hypothetical protein Taro_047714 [Colocasia esculenta]|uniref:Uncharacterized protein n=1 Tax=Colocasia esculenta TaxID=4460 RepID=A0A843X483_COLES|nr:hypothetical protein [Colocasia esculenta]